MSQPMFKATGKSAPTNPTLQVQAGDYIFRQNDLGTEMFIVHSGEVELLAVRNDKEIRLAVMEKGDFFGEMSLLDDLPRNASARALKDATLVTITGSMFVQMLRREPEIAIRIMRKFSRRLREADKRLLELPGGQEAADRAASEASAAESGPPKKNLGPERLMHTKSGMDFFLDASEETTVGRRDPVTGIYPEVDLTPVDNQRSISRRHAKVYRRGGRFYAAEEIGTMNGTFVNGVKLETGVPVEIKPGDEVRFGMVVTIFQFS